LATDATTDPSGFPPTVSFEALLWQPGLIWGCSGEECLSLTNDFARLDGDGFRWLHLNLADGRTHAWLERENRFPPEVHELLLSREDHPRAVIDGKVVGLVLQDFERDFDHDDFNQVGALHVAIAPKLIVTGRYRPVRCADIMRQRIARVAVAPDPAAALDLVLDSMTGIFADLARQLTVEVQAAEDQFLNDNPADAGRELLVIRRRSARLHRMVAGMRAVLHRLEDDRDLPKPMEPVIERFAQRADAIDADILAIQGQMRVLRDEFDLQAAQKTNDNLYFLSVMSALLLPATLVTGFFGMNTGGLPMTGGPNGTIEAMVIALVASGATWALLRARR
jgi:Mg2+ and Co2+ transporter CorA